MTPLVTPRENRRLTWRTCASCETDLWWARNERPPVACPWCLEPFPVPERVHDDTKRLARMAKAVVAILLLVGAGLLLLHALGCDAVPEPPIQWDVGDCYISKYAHDTYERILSGAAPPWEAKNSIFFNKLVADWEYITTAEHRRYFHTAYTTKLDSWHTGEGDLWTETPESLLGKIKVPCPTVREEVSS